MKKSIVPLLVTVMVLQSTAVFAENDYDFSRILSTSVGDNYVSVELENLGIDKDDYYSVNCEKDLGRYLFDRTFNRWQASIDEDAESFDITVRGLWPDTFYTCKSRIGVRSVDGNGYYFSGYHATSFRTKSPEFTGRYSDIDESHTNQEAITYLTAAGVFDGYPDGNFKPSNTINRAELLKILVEARGFSVAEENDEPEDYELDGYNNIASFGNCFEDVKYEWFAPYVCKAKAAGWVTGYNDGYFRPDQAVNKVEALRMLMTTQSVETTDDVPERPYQDVPTDAWYSKYVAKSKDMGLLEETGNYYNPASGMKRGSIAESIYRLLSE